MLLLLTLGYLKGLGPRVDSEPWKTGISLGFPFAFIQPLSFTFLHGPQTWAVILMLPLPLLLSGSWALTVIALLQVFVHTPAFIWALNLYTAPIPI